MENRKIELGTSYEVRVRESVVEEFLQKFSGEFSLEKFPKNLIASGFAININYDNCLSISSNYWFENALAKMKNYTERVQRENQIPQVAKLRASGCCIGISKDFKYLKLYGKYRLEDLLEEGFCHFETCCYGGSEDYPVPTGEFHHIQEQPLKAGYPGIYREKGSGGYYVDYIEIFVKFLEDDKTHLNIPRPVTEGKIIGDIVNPNYDGLLFSYDAIQFNSYYGKYSATSINKEDALILDDLLGSVKSSFNANNAPVWFLTNLPKSSVALLENIEIYSHPTKKDYYFCQVETKSDRLSGQIKLHDRPTKKETTEWLKETSSLLRSKSRFYRDDLCLIRNFNWVYNNWCSVPDGWLVEDGQLSWSKEAPFKSCLPLKPAEAIEKIIGKEPQIKKWDFNVETGLLSVFIWEVSRKKHFIGDNGCRIKKITEVLRPLGVKEIKI